MRGLAIAGSDSIGDRRRRCRILDGGDVSERPKELASKASVVQATEGSNPSVTAI